jgi:type IV pilus assembly protein PilM
MLNTSVCLSSGILSVISGDVSKSRIKVNTAACVRLPQGSAINGLITDEPALHTILVELRKAGKLPTRNARLVVDSSSILTKLMEVPVLPQKHLLDFTKSVFVEVADTYEELLYDYSVVDNKHILCSAIQKSLVESYIDLFAAAGIKLAAIDISLNCVIKLAYYLQELQNKTYVLLIIDGQNIFAILFINGKYAFSNRSHLLSEQNTEKWQTEVLGIVSSLRQFHSSQKNEYEISDVYFCGLQEDENNFCCNISNYMDINAQVLPENKAVIINKNLATAGFLLSDYIFAIGNLIERK